jgi:ribonuclease VapC
VQQGLEIKARYPLSYADAFATAAALRMNAAILTGDPEFRAVRDLVPIEWVVQP